MQFHEKLVDFLIRHKTPILVITVLITAFFGWAMTGLQVDNDPAHALPNDMKQKVDIRYLREKFHSPYTMLFMCKLEEGTLQEKLAIVDSFSTALGTVKVKDSAGVAQPGFEKIISVSSLSVPVKGGMFGVKNKKLLDSTLSTEELQQLVSENSAITGRFISKDQTVFLTVLLSNESVDRQIAIGEAQKVVDGFRKDGHKETYIAGETAIAWFLNTGMRHDFARLLPIAILLAIGVLAILFKRITFVLAPMLIIAISLIWGFGLMSLTGFKFSVLTSVIPLILFPVGLADSIHIIKTFGHHRRLGKNYRDAFVLTYEELLVPVFLTSITTFFGFSSLAFSSLTWTQTFGIFTGFAVMVALLLSVVLLPILLLHDAKVDFHEDKEIQIMPVSFMEKFIFGSPGAWISLILVVGFSLFFIPKLIFENNPIAFFSKGHDLVMTDSIVGKEFGGSRFFDLLIESDQPINDSLRWSKIATITEMVKKEENVGQVTSLLPVINRLCMLTKGEPLANSTIDMLLGGKGMFGKNFGEVIKAGITEDRKAIKVSITCKNVPQFNYTILAEKIKKDIESKYPHYKVTPAGQALMIDAGVNEVTMTQVNSLLSTFITVALVLMLVYRSIRTGLLTTLPIVVATLFIAGLMSALHVSINSITVIIMNCAVGIGIDYAIHYTAGFLRERKLCDTPRQAAMETIRHKGTVIIFNTVAVGGGFLVLMISAFPPVRDLGLFIFLSMAISALFSLVFLPLFLMWLRPLKK